MSGAAERLNGNGHHLAVIRVIERMRDDLSATLPLVDLARIGLFSPFYFHRVFRAVTGETPARFMAALRMAQARRLLQHSRLTVCAISSRVGYTSVGSFTTQFSRLVGVPPNRFRRLVRLLAGRRIEPMIAEPTSSQDAGVLLCAGVRVEQADLAGALLVGVARSNSEAMNWTVSSGGGMVTLPRLAPGRYYLRMVLLRTGWPATAALVDQIPESYLLGRTEFVISEQARLPYRVSVRLRPPRPIDPPLLSAEPIRLVADLLSVPGASAPVALSA